MKKDQVTDWVTESCSENWNKMGHGLGLRYGRILFQKKKKNLNRTVLGKVKRFLHKLRENVTASGPLVLGPWSLSSSAPLRPRHCCAILLLYYSKLTVEWVKWPPGFELLVSGISFSCLSGRVRQVGIYPSCYTFTGVGQFLAQLPFSI